ncbi:hypothetical protein ACFYPW_26185 [Micromonospora zamorensis]|uniref:hypothetical protein n=1 Tax=Micromonospora zamorensis TaxID=709883 RepID=UPI003685E133
MTDNLDRDEGERWRSSLVQLIYGDDVGEATDALLALSLDEPDREWIEDVLLRLLDAPVDRQVRELAVTCIGHVARLHHAISQKTIARLHELTDDPELRLRVPNALSDISVFAKNS